jgi:hypothetical protein
MLKIYSVRPLPLWPGLSLLSAIGLAVFVAGCSSVKSHVDEGRISARTFSFLNTASRQTPNYAEDSKQAHAMVQQAIINNLAGKGITNLPSGGDITVAYLIIVGNNISTTSLNEYFGYTEDSMAMVQEVHKKQTASQGNRGYFEAGTLVIDFLSPATSKVLQRRSIEAPILRNLPTEQRTERVQTIVNQALSDLPIAP